MALKFVLEFINVKDLLKHAMNDYYSDNKENADIIFKVIQVFLRY